MKKLITGVIAAAAILFGFASCAGNLHDAEAIDMSVLYLRGDMNGWGTTPLTRVDDDNYTVTFTATSNPQAFAIASSDANWSIAYRKTADDSACVEFSGDDVSGKTVKSLYNGGGLSNATIATTVGTDYTLYITRDLGFLNVYVEENKIVAEDADLSAINATTMAQPNAYIQINGDAWSDATVGKYFFNKSGDDYVAIIPFNIASDASNSWGNDHYQAWGNICVGDGATVSVASNQFNYDAGKLNFAAKNNIDLSTIVAGTKGVITVTAGATDCTITVTLY